MTKLRDYRKNSGMSQEALGKSAGLSRQSINSLENGTMPRLVHAMRISKVLNAPVEKIFSDRLEGDGYHEQSLIQKEAHVDKDMLSYLPAAQHGEIRLVVLEGSNTFIAQIQRDKIESVMNAFEKKTGLGPNDHEKQMAHAMVRRIIADALRKPNAEDEFTRVLAVGVMWLAMRHWSNATEIVKGVNDMLDAGKTPVITASIANPVNPDTLPDTAWAFMVGFQIHDGRDQLLEMSPNQVKIIRNADGKVEK